MKIDASRSPSVRGVGIAGAAPWGSAFDSLDVKFRPAVTGGKSRDRRLIFLSTRRPDMLVISRLVDERIILRDTVSGAEIIVTMLEGRVGKARIGIAAPNYVTINREEVQRRIDAHVNPQSVEDNSEQ